MGNKIGRGSGFFVPQEGVTYIFIFYFQRWTNIQLLSGDFVLEYLQESQYKKAYEIGSAEFKNIYGSSKRTRR